MRCVGLVLISLAALSSGCGEKLPADVLGYETRCVKLNLEPIEPIADPDEKDPHDGFKNVYVCGMDASELLARLVTDPFPDGVMIVKESTKQAQGYVWLIATMRKQSGAWKWDEYTRNFVQDDYLRVPVTEEVCSDCHRKVEALDYVYTQYQAPVQ